VGANCVRTTLSRPHGWSPNGRFLEVKAILEIDVLAAADAFVADPTAIPF
jgi:hypothetical protein